LGGLNLETISFVAQSFLFLYTPICQSFLLVTEPFEFYWGSHCLCLLLPVYSLFPTYTTFRVLSLILRSFIHFCLIFVHGERHRYSFSFLPADTQFSQQHLLNSLSFLHHMFGHLCQKLGEYRYVD
jgi:hypothetical protein